MATIVGTSGNNPNLNGAGERDYIFGLAGNDTLRGFGNHDQLFGGSGNDQLFGGTGNDRLKGGLGNDLLNGGDGIDTADYSNATIDPPGSVGPIFTTGATAGVTVDLNLTGAQNTGGAGTDTLVSIENLTGSSFNDTLTGNSGNNTLLGLGGNDTLNGGSGNDILNGGSGNDTLSGGAGNDTADYSTATAGVTVTLFDGDGQATGGAGTDQLVSIENVTGSEAHAPFFDSGGNDILTGDSGNNRLSGLSGIDLLFGKDGNDQLFGGFGADFLNGGNDNDRLVGGFGGDTLNGGRGNDIFDYNESQESPFNGQDEDLIIGFAGAGTAIGDQIDLSTIDADLTLPGNQAFTEEQISYFKDEEQNHGVLWVEIIGRGTGPELVIELDGDPTLFIQAGHPGSDILL